MKTFLLSIGVVAALALSGCSAAPEAQNDEVQDDIQDMKQAYWTDETLERLEPDMDTFEVIEEYPGYAKDKNAVYQNFAGGPRVLEDLDPASFQVLSYEYFMDKDAVYFGIGEYVWGHRKVEGSDAASFEYIDGYFAKDENNIYYHGKVAKDIDVSTFVYMSERYVKDENSVFITSYSDEVKTIDVDLDTFELYEFFPYARDKDHVYSSGEILISADPETFGRVSKSGYYKDKSNLYWQGRLLSDDGAGSFELLEDLGVYPPNVYAKDDINVYHFGDVIEGADSESFQRLDSDYSVDKNFVFHRSSKLIGLSPDAFEIVEPARCNNAKSDEFVFHNAFVIQNADPATFETAYGCYVKDKDSVYLNGQIVKGADPASFRDFGCGYAKDRGGYFLGGRAYYDFPPLCEKE